MIRKPVVIYKEINNGFKVSEEGSVIFEKASASTQLGLRDIIKERYKKGKILKVCQTCERNCKQVLAPNSTFKCYLKFYDYKKKKQQEKK